MTDSKRVFNFSPGPAMLPEAVLKTAQAEMLNWQETGMSVMELPHRGEWFQTIIHQTEADLRALLSIPSHYRILFLPDGATAQFAMVPLNLFSKTRTADYIETGIWSKKAIQEASRYGNIHVAATTQITDHFITIPPQSTWSLRPEAAYVHYTPNETIEGIQFNWVPETGSVPLVGDFSSMILSCSIPVEKYGIIYASAQKNLGPAGITIVIIREDLLQPPLAGTPTLYTYAVHAEQHSMVHTPPTYNWYMMGLVLTWVKEQGGVAVMEQCNQRKAKLLYQCIDQYPTFYFSRVHPSCRSFTNVVYDLPTLFLRERFLAAAHEAGLVHLKGHRLHGGIRASLYNAMPEAGVTALVDFMHHFVKHYG